MNYLGDNLGLTGDQTDKMLQFQDLTGIEDMTICRDVLQRHQWNLEVAVQEQLNIREGRPSLYATETRAPAVVSDLVSHHVFYTPATDGSDTGIGGLFRSIWNLFFNVCYNTIITFIQISRRLLGIEYRPRVDAVTEVLDFIRSYEEKYGTDHPVFYQGTFAQVLNDAKRELRFLLVYLHDSNMPDTELFCCGTLAHQDVIRYINQHFLFWGCAANSEEGHRTQSTLKSNYYPFLSVLVLKENKMTVVGRFEGYADADTLIQRLASVVAEYEINLVQARADRFETSLNRSLRAHQDEAFMESLRADQEKDRKREMERMAAEAEQRRLEEEARREEERRQSIEREKMESVDKVPEEPPPDHPEAIHVVFKLPCGSRLVRRFLTSHSLEAVFYFVFCHPMAPDSFEITTNFPKRVLQCRPSDNCTRVQTLAEAGLKNREVLFVNDLDA